MRLRIATVFALLLFIILALALLQMSRRMPAPEKQSTAPFAFDLSRVDGQHAYRILEQFLAISPRDAGTDGAVKAAEYISGFLLTSGVDTMVYEFEADTPRGMKKFRNVSGKLRGDGKSCIVLLSHFDTKSGISAAFTGANDSGSSTALLLHLAASVGPSTSAVPDLVFAFVDGEECFESYTDSDGLIGSRRLVKDLMEEYPKDNIRAVILLDMIGDSDLTITVPNNSSPDLVKRLFAAAREENARDKLSLYGPILDDHVPFLEAGIPAVDIIDFYYGSAPRANDYWHTDKDTLDRISPDSLAIAGRLALRIVNSLIAEPAVK
jgi:Zn-dependent M28 family amino/carboxypeptidase